MSRFREPSTWASLGIIAGSVAVFCGLTPDKVAAISGAVASLGVILRERAP